MNTCTLRFLSTTFRFLIVFLNWWTLSNLNSLIDFTLLGGVRQVSIPWQGLFNEHIKLCIARYLMPELILRLRQLVLRHHLQFGLLESDILVLLLLIYCVIKHRALVFSVR